VSIREASLSAIKLEAFKSEIVDGWKANAEAREIVQIVDAYEFVSVPVTDVRMWGFNELQPKDTYIDDSEMTITGWGSQFGRDLALSENQRFLEDLVSNINDFNTDIDQPLILDVISKMAEDLDRSKSSLVILILDSWEERTFVENSHQFRVGVDARSKSFIGHFNDMPVFNLHYHGDPYVAVVDIKKYCVWRQFKPSKQEHGEYLTDEMAFSLQAFSVQTATDAVKMNKKLLQDKNGSPVPEETAILDLLLHVHFQLGEQFEICRKENYKSAGYKIRVFSLGIGG
jgi:hypothetical protein